MSLASCSQLLLIALAWIGSIICCHASVCTIHHQRSEVSPTGSDQDDQDRTTTDQEVLLPTYQDKDEFKLAGDYRDRLNPVPIAEPGTSVTHEDAIGIYTVQSPPRMSIPRSPLGSNHVVGPVIGVWTL